MVKPFLIKLDRIVRISGPFLAGLVVQKESFYDPNEL